MEHFNATTYLANKLAQMKKASPSYTLEELNAALKAAGLTPLEHFQQYGWVEGVNPSSSFDVSAYLDAKVAQVKKSDPSYTTDKLIADLKAAGLDPVTHYEKYGWAELLNGNSQFDVTAYLTDKAALLSKEQANGKSNWTVSDVIKAFQDAGINPEQHYELYGQKEGLVAKAVGGGTVTPPVEPGPNTDTTTYLTVAQDNVTGTTSDDTFIADVSQNMLGQQVNTLGSGDVINGGSGTDTLLAKITGGAYINGGSTMPIQPRTNSVENVVLEAELNDAIGGDKGVHVNAKDMVGVKYISSNHSDADLTVMNLTTKGSEKLTDLTVNMSYSGNANSGWKESDFKVLFDQDYLTRKTSPIVAFLAMNEDNYDQNPANALEGVFFRELQFNLNGQTFDLTQHLGEDPKGAGDEIKTYSDFLNAVQKALELLKADHAENAALQTVTAKFGSDFTTDVSPTTGELRVGKSISLDVESTTNGKDNKLSVESTDLEVARAANATVPNNNRYERAANDSLDGTVAINVELEKAGLTGDGGALVIGSMNKGDDFNQWDAVNTVGVGTTSGINEFYVTVKGGADKSSSLSQLRSTNNQLKVVTVATDSAQTEAATYANLQIGNVHTAETNDGLALKDVQTFDASAFKGDLTLQAALTEEVTAKYLNLKDKAPNAAAADNVHFKYTGGTGNDTIDLVVDSENLAKPGTVTREDMTVTIDTGKGNDKVILSVVEDAVTGTLAATGGASHWYNNQKLNANMFINTGEGDDTIWTPGGGDVKIDAGVGNDTVYSGTLVDPEANKAVWVLNAVQKGNNADLDNIQSGWNHTYHLYKTDVVVNFLGYESAFAVPDINGKADDLAINQAIKKAINDHAVLSKLLVAEDGPANTLVITTLIDGARATTDFTVGLLQRELTTSDIATLKNYGIDESHIANSVTYFNNNLNTVTGEAVYFREQYKAGADHQYTSDNIIYGDLGNDVIALSTNSLSNDTVVYNKLNSGNDTIVDFQVGEVELGFTNLPANGADILDFSAFHVEKFYVAQNETNLKAVGTLLKIDDIDNDKATKVGSYITLVESNDNDGFYTATYFENDQSTGAFIATLDFGIEKTFAADNILI